MSSPATPNTAAAAASAGDQATAAVEKAVDQGAAAAEKAVATVATDVEQAVAPAAKSAEIIIQEGADHIKQFVEKNLPTLEAQGHDFAGSLGTKLKGWLADVEKFFATKAA